ncbi:hypothetical protein HDU78_001977 [Chytriomyces hyalinus]|nr:hypothetical protein HDU78_001977 [Chytriomyces hyalinus]
MEHTFHDLSKKTQIFRSRLIDEFHLLDDVANTARVKAPKHTSRDMLDLKMRNKMLLENPHQLVKFQVFKKPHWTGDEDVIDRRLTRTKNVSSLPLGAWAGWLGRQKYYQQFIYWLVFVDVIFVGVKTELAPVQARYWVLFQFIQLLDWFASIVFVLDIARSWIDSFEDYWNHTWNIADFAVTVFSLVPEITDATGTTARLLIKNGVDPQIFRIFRTLKLVFRYSNFQIMVITIFGAFHSMSTIMLLVFIVSFAYAVVGVYLFLPYTLSKNPALRYQHCFMDLGQSMLTLFQLLTLDQWDDILRDLEKESDPVWTNLYVISWVCLGAFIFRNIFIGVMVNHFDKISKELKEELEAKEKAKNYERMRRKLNKELSVQEKVTVSIANLKDAADTKGRLSQANMVEKRQASVSSHDSQLRNQQQDVLETVKKLLVTTSGIQKGWEETVQETLIALKDANVETLWPKDSLLEYLQVMENLQENMKEYEELQIMCSWSLLELHDT